MLTIKDLSGNEVPLTAHGTIAQNKKLFEVETIEFDAYDWKESDTAYQMITERSLIYLPDTEQWYRVLNRSTSQMGDVMVNHVTAFHVLHDLNEHYAKEPPKPKETGDDGTEAKGDEDQSVEMSLNQFMSYITQETKFSFSINSSFSSAAFDSYPEGRALDLFLNAGREAFGYEFSVDNYHINLVQKVGKDNSFVFINNGNVANINSNYDDSTITTHIKGESTVKDRDDLSGNDSNSSEGTIQPTHAIGTVSNINGAFLFKRPKKGTENGRVLSNGSSWKIDQQVTADGETWYRVATNEWVKGSDIVFDKNGDVQPEQHKVDHVLGQGTIKASNDQISANVYDSPWSPQNIIRTLANGTRWRIDQKVDSGAQAKTWYRVATNQWVASDDFDFSANEDVTPKDKDDPDTANSSTEVADDGTETIYAEYTSPAATIYGQIDADYYTSEKAVTEGELIEEMKQQIQDYPLMQITLDYHQFRDGLVDQINDISLGNSGWIKNRHGLDISSRILEMTNYLQAPVDQESTLVFGNVIGDFATTLATLRHASASSNNISNSFLNSASGYL